jgi:hypothetical protein
MGRDVRTKEMHGIVVTPLNVLDINGNGTQSRQLVSVQNIEPETSRI